MTLTYLPFYIAPPLPFPPPGRCFKTWVLITYPFFFLSLCLRPIAPMRIPLPLTFRKLAGMSLPFTLTPTVLLQRNTRLFLFPLLLLSSSLPLWPNLPFLLAASNALLKSGDLLRWKVQLVKDARLLVLLTEVMKIARLTSLLFDAFCQPLPRPRLKHDKRLAFLFHPNLTLNLYTLFFALSLAVLPRLLPLLTSLTVLLLGNQLWSMLLT